jgi:hypothetical protein
MSAPEAAGELIPEFGVMRDRLIESGLNRIVAGEVALQMQGLAMHADLGIIHALGGHENPAVRGLAQRMERLAHDYLNVILALAVELMQTKLKLAMVEAPSGRAN